MTLKDKMLVAAEYGLRAPRSVCDCGHTGDGHNSEHSTLNNARGRLGLTVGHYRCLVAECGCSQFTWDHFTDVFQAALDKVSK